jgi:hypothetical protein
MTDASKAHTHTAYAFSRLGKKHGRMLEVGTGRIDREKNLVHILMTRTPISGYTGYVVLSPIGAPPPVPQPPRPIDSEADEDTSDQSDV